MQNKEKNLPIPKNIYMCKRIYHTKRKADVNVRYHSGGSMELNACILLLAHMVYL
jgi:hypothetical protein